MKHPLIRLQEQASPKRQRRNHWSWNDGEARKIEAQRLRREKCFDVALGSALYFVATGQKPVLTTPGQARTSQPFIDLSEVL